MEHIVRSLNSDEEIDDIVEGDMDAQSIKSASRSMKKRSSDDLKPEVEDQLLGVDDKTNRRLSTLSMSDVADRHLRDKTDAIAHLIRNISDQCAAAVESLQLANLEADEEFDEAGHNRNRDTLQSDVGSTSARTDYGSEYGENSYLHPEHRHSSVPPTPDLSHRSSTAMSIVSSSTVPERTSQQFISNDIPTKIVEHDDEYAHEQEQLQAEDTSMPAIGKVPVASKQASQATLRVGANAVSQH